MNLVDTHCHLNDAEAFPDPGVVVAEASAAGVSKLIVIGVDLPSSRLAVELSEEFDGVFAAVGHHPNYASSYEESELTDFDSMLHRAKTVALGEIGLDYHWDYATRAEQERCLRDQLNLARQHKKPLIFHCREANKDLLAILENEPRQRFVLHCFSGDVDDARKANEMGCWFGVDGPVSYPKSEELRALLRTVRRDRILIETDSPWLAPHPFRGKPNRPALLTYVNAALAPVLDLTIEECAALTTANAESCFGLDRELRRD